MYYILRALLAVSIALPLLSAVAVALRFYARKLKQMPLLIDDWLVLITWLLIATVCVIGIYGTFTFSLGQLPSAVSLAQSTGAYKFLFSILMIDTLAFGLVKISVLTFYKRLFSVGQFKLWANALVVIVSGWTISGIVTLFFAARPLKNAWTGHWAINWGKFNTCMAGIDLIFDILILLLPLIAIQELQVSRAQKWSITGLFGLGSICIIASSTRLYYNWEFTLLGPDSSYTSFQEVVNSISIWLVVEGNMSIIAACMPTLGALIHNKVSASISGSMRARKGLRRIPSQNVGQLSKSTIRICGNKSPRFWMEGTSGSSEAKVEGGQKQSENHVEEMRTIRMDGIRVDRSFGWS